MKGSNVRKINFWIGAIALSIIVIPFFSFTNNAYGTESGTTPEPSVVASASAEPTTAPTADPTLTPTNPSVDPSADPTASPDPTVNPSVEPTPDPTTAPEPTPSAEPSQEVVDGGGSSGGSSGESSGGGEAVSEPDPTPKPWYVDPSRASSTPTGSLGNYAIISGGKTINVIVLDPSDTKTGGGSSWVDWFNSENGRNVYGEGAVLVEVGSGDWTQPGHDTVIGEEPVAP